LLGVRAARAREDGRLELVEVQPAGGRPMSYTDYLRGHEPAEGVA
jgi:methionyl-tRNA formyltransferase